MSGGDRIIGRRHGMALTALGPDWRTQVARTPHVTRLLVCPPEHYEVLDVKNAFMQGHVGDVDRVLAAQQWQRLQETLRQEGVRVEVLAAAPGREDMVFTANGVTVVPRTQGGADVVLSRFRYASRQAEVPHVRRWLQAAGLMPVALPAEAGFLEGHGDVLVVPGRRLLLGGHGGRSELSALAALSALIDVPLVPLPLAGDVFYHLDTCLCLLDEDSALLHPPAFRPEALEQLERLFPRLIEADPQEAREQMACNARALPGGAVVLSHAATRTAARLSAAGYRPVPVELSEFHKSGGSVFCLGLPLP
jgi:N-dimethylarginine dimethylaminohydrolase